MGIIDDSAPSFHSSADFDISRRFLDVSTPIREQGAAAAHSSTDITGRRDMPTNATRSRSMHSMTFHAALFRRTILNAIISI